MSEPSTTFRVACEGQHHPFEVKADQIEVTEGVLKFISGATTVCVVPLSKLTTAVRLDSLK